MEPITRPFDFDYRGLRVYCCAYLYSDGSLQRIEIEYVRDGLLDYVALLHGSRPALVRYIRMKLMKALRTAAAFHASAALAYQPDNLEFEF